MMELIPTSDSKIKDIESNAIGIAPAIGGKKRYDQIIQTLQSEKANKTSRDIKWNNINYSVEGPNGKIPILTNCWGSIPAGKVCAIMGPSGAGKSSLLNVLAGRSAPGNGASISGTVNVAGVDINPVSYRKNIAYVMQDDALLSTSTPREALRFSARLRLPDGTPDDVIEDLVDAMLDELGLEECADTLIGGSMIKGISGGQMKRTSVGIELITNPSLLFLDEPTSGLDAYSAFKCVELLKRVASHNTAVLCTIHQPSSEVFELFDLVIFMVKGRILYQGPVNELVAHFSKFGYICPANYNPADFIMFLSQQESLANLQEKGAVMSLPPTELALSEASSKEWNSSATDAFTSEAPFLKQVKLLTTRELERIQRDKAALIGRFGVTIFLNLLVGLIFYRAGDKDDNNPTNFQSHFGALTLFLLGSMFFTAQPTMLEFPYERPMFLREYSTGTYGALEYFISKLTLELPVTFAQSCVQGLVCYFLCRFNASFIILVLISWALGVASSSIAIILGSILSNVKAVTELAPILFVPQMLFVGFFVRTSQIPDVLNWAQYLCGLKYAMNLVLLAEFNPDKNSNCDGPMARALCEGVLEMNDVERDQSWVYILLLVALIAMFRIVAAFLLIQKAKKFY